MRSVKYRSYYTPSTYECWCRPCFEPYRKLHPLAYTTQLPTYTMCSVTYLHHVLSYLPPCAQLPTYTMCSVTYLHHVLTYVHLRTPNSMGVRHTRIFICLN